jgi:hypothetical protein
MDYWKNSAMEAINKSLNEHDLKEANINTDLVTGDVTMTLKFTMKKSKPLSEKLDAIFNAEESQLITFDTIEGKYIQFRESFDVFGKRVTCGWVKKIDIVNDYIEVRCDDGFKGARGTSIRICDVIAILPYKEEPK